MSEAMTLADIERLCWTLSGWQVDQRDVDRLLAAVQAYASSSPAEMPVKGSAGPQETPAEPLMAATTPVPPTGLQTGVQTVRIEGACMLTLIPLTDVPVPLTQPRRRRMPATYAVPAADLYETERTCTTCGDVKAIAGFNRDQHSRGGRRTQCRDCERERRLKREAERARTAQE